MSEGLSREAISSIVHSYPLHYEIALDPDNTSRIRDMEQVVDLISQRYCSYFNMALDNRKPDHDERDMDYAFLATEAYAVERSELNPIEARVMGSDLLTMHYLVVQGGLDDLYYRYIEKSSGSGDDPNKFTQEDILDIKSELAAEFVARQREKSKEHELCEKYPNAPTTGFEFEYEDPLRTMANSRHGVDTKIHILETLAGNDAETAYKILEASDSLKDRDYRLFYLQSLGEDKTELEHEADVWKRIKYSYDQILTLSADLPARETESDDLGRKIGMYANSDRMKRALQKQLEQESDPEQRVIIEGLIKLHDPASHIEKGKVLSPQELLHALTLVPTQTQRLAWFGPFKDVPEQRVLREYVSDPSISVKMQLRDFFYALQAGALSGELTIHQTLAGIEITPDNMDFTEVRAISEAAGYNGGDPVEEEQIAQILDAYARDEVYVREGWRKSSVYNGRSYIIPHHRNRGIESLQEVRYPGSESRSLVELRSYPAFDPKADFSRMVKLTTFNWLTAWGAQAKAITVEQRTADEVKLAQAWDDLLQGWRQLALEKDIYVPQPHERYLELDTSTDPPTSRGTEKYTHYLGVIRAVRIKDNQEAKSNEPRKSGTLQQEAQKLVIAYRSKVRQIIGY